MKNSLTFVLLVGTILISTAAHAQVDPTTAILRHGVELRASGDDAGALGEFRRAYEQSHSPLALAQMGLAEQALAQWVAAESHVRAALAVQGDGWIDRHRDALTAAYAVIQQHVGRLQIVGGVPGAELIVNGERRGTLPISEPVVVLAGDAHVEVRTSGGTSRVHDVTVAAASIVRDVLPDETASAPVAASRVVTTAPRQADSVRGSERSFLPLAVGAGAVVLVGVGFAGLAMRESIVSNYNTSCRGFGDPTPTAACNEASNTSSANGANALAATGFIAGGVLGVVAAVLFAVPSRGHGERNGVAFRCGGGPGDIGISCGGAF